jgi:hypothetical protein
VTLRHLRLIASFPPERRRLILEALPLVVAIRLALWVFPSPSLLRFVSRRVERSGRSGRTKSAQPVERLAWAVRVVSRRVPHATCLTQALAAQLLLARYGCASSLQLGVRYDEDERFDAHAWVVVEGAVIIGGDGLDRYIAMPELRGALEPRGPRPSTRPASRRLS